MSTQKKELYPAMGPATVHDVYFNQLRKCSWAPPLPCSPQPAHWSKINAQGVDSWAPAQQPCRLKMQKLVGGQRPGGPAPKAQQPGQLLGGQDVAQEPSTGSAQEQAAWRELQYHIDHELVSTSNTYKSRSNHSLVTHTKDSNSTTLKMQSQNSLVES